MSADPTSALHALCYVLAGVYGALVCWTLRQLVAFARATAGHRGACCGGGWNSQKALHALALLVGAARIAFFAVVPGWSSDFFYGRISSGRREESWQFILDELPSLLLVALTSAHVFIWARAYHAFRHADAAFSRRVLPLLVGANAALWLAQLALWVVFEAYPPAADAISLTSALLHVVAFSGLAAMLSFYATGLVGQYMSVPMSLGRRLARARELRAIAGTTAACFLARSAAVFLVSVTTAVRDDGFDGLVDTASPGELAFTGFFFVALELLPLCALLWHHRRVAVVARLGPGSATPTALLKRRLSELAAAARTQQALLARGGRGGGGGGSGSESARLAAGAPSPRYGATLQQQPSVTVVGGSGGSLDGATGPLTPAPLAGAAAGKRSDPSATADADDDARARLAVAPHPKHARRGAGAGGGLLGALTQLLSPGGGASGDEAGGDDSLSTGLMRASLSGDSESCGGADDAPAVVDDAAAAEPDTGPAAARALAADRGP